MRDRLVTKVIDSRAVQGRMIIWLECKHIKSIDPREWALMPRPLIVGDITSCPYCADAPVIPPRMCKSATQLWREAGEPDAC